MSLISALCPSLTHARFWQWGRETWADFLFATSATGGLVLLVFGTFL